jgi:hypothetical protein
MKTKLNFTQSIKAGAFTSIAAAAINSILFFIFHAAGVFTDDIFIQPDQPLTVVPILISSIVPTLIASIVFFLIEKYSSNGFNIFRIVAIVLLVLSFMNPFMGIKGVTAPYALCLNLMHITIVVFLLYFLNKEKKAINA